MIAQHVTTMVQDKDKDRVVGLLSSFGEEPPEDMTLNDMGQRLLRLAFLSTGLRQLLEDDILGTVTKVYFHSARAISVL